ncbi:hypothetical protein ILUMI_10909 [Ignelater luminosus]|uniref:Uncharacterized protein n=1 Tax=Ignelater luminosus TaxID=2038154 RepID=A0A8K0G882_IGNLU|nr:hypothetical protein ILUMI_10909 [Ignelater luminosus]
MEELEDFQRALTMARPPEDLSTPTTSTTATTVEAKKPSKNLSSPADAAAHSTSDVASVGADATATGQSRRASIERETTPPASPAPSYSEVLQRPGSACRAPRSSRTPARTKMTPTATTPGDRSTPMPSRRRPPVRDTSSLNWLNFLGGLDFAELARAIRALGKNCEAAGLADVLAAAGTFIQDIIAT